MTEHAFCPHGINTTGTRFACRQCYDELVDDRDELIQMGYEDERNRLRTELAAARSTITEMEAGYGRAARMIVGLKADLAAARALLREMDVADQDLRDRIDAALAGEKRNG